MPVLILFNKPFGVLSQFRADANNDYGTLAEYVNNKRLKVAGRLDATSEGLLLLTDSGRLNHLLTRPLISRSSMRPFDKPLPCADKGKTYWVQVEGVATQLHLEQLRMGIRLKDGITLPAIVDKLTQSQTASIWQAPMGVAKRATTTWLSMTIFEGKNRQIRRMTASVGLPCLRLIRMSSHNYTVQGIEVGRFVRVSVSDNTIQTMSLTSVIK